MALDISVKIDIEIFKKKNTSIPNPNPIQKKNQSAQHRNRSPHGMVDPARHITTECNANGSHQYSNSTK